ncbi:hypothetical protein C3L33_12447, partial [Rhododendron williamsianum]
FACWQIFLMFINLNVFVFVSVAGSIMSLSAMVTVNSIEIFNTHAWLPSKPTVYFQCKGENKTYLPDVKKTHFSYTFKGEESWQVLENYLSHPYSSEEANSKTLILCLQPLMEFPNTKCKRCGFYEEDILKSDEFDEWEFCPSDFTNRDGSYNKFKEEEFNATFLCPDCVPLGSDSNHASGAHNGGKGMDLAIAHNGG